MDGTRRALRIANGQGFWGDSVDAPIRLVEDGPLDYLTLDYLAEVTMSILQKQRRRDPRMGYATDFVDLIRRILPTLRAKGIRVVANAGGVNADACRKALVEVAREQGATGLRIGTVTGDDILDRLDELTASGVPFASLDDGRPFSVVRERVLSANVYILAGLPSHEDRIADNVRQVLMQAAAAGDIEGLRAPANAQDRQLPPERLPSHRVLGAIEPRLGRAELDVGPRTIGLGGEVWTSREHEPVETGEHTPNIPVTERRHDHRNTAGGLGCPHVGHPKRHLRVRRLAMTTKRDELPRA